MRRIGVVIALVAALALAACGSESDEDATSVPSTDTPTTTAPAEDQALQERLEHWRQVARESTCAELADLEQIKAQDMSADAVIALRAIHERQADVSCPA
jgi:hypothetical protein